MSRLDADFNKLHRHFIGIVTEGLHDVAIFVYHVKLLCHQSKQCTLNTDREQDNENNYVRQGVGSDG